MHVARPQPPVIGESRVASRETPTGANDDAALRKVALQMQSVFAEQLFKAMRETVPRGEGAVDGGGGEEMFTGLMDQRLAADTPTQWGRHLSEAIVRQLRRSIDASGAAGAPATPTTDPVTAPATAATAATVMTAMTATTAATAFPLNDPTR